MTTPIPGRLFEVSSEALEAERELVSLVICSYNQERTIAEAIKSALEQTYSPLEVIVSDDFSTDSTYSIAERVAAAYTGRHRLILNRNSENLGIARHWDTISRKASGKLIVHGAGDDVSLPQRVEVLVRAWNHCKPRPYLLSSNAIEMSLAGKDRQRLINFPDSDEPMVQGVPDGLDFDRLDIYVPGCSLAVDRRLYERLPPLSTWMWSEDDILRSRALLLGPIAFVPLPLVRYRDGGLSKGAELDQTSYIARFVCQARARLNYLEQLEQDYGAIHGRSRKFTALVERKKASARRRIQLVQTRSFAQSLWTLGVQVALRARTDGVTRGQYLNMFLVRWFPSAFFGARQLYRRLRPA